MDPAAIRTFGPDDSLEELTALLHRAYAELGARGWNYTAVDQTEGTTRRRIEGKECLLAVLGGRTAGTVTLALSAPPEARPVLGEGPSAYLSQFAVDPRSRGLGVGRALLDRAEAMAAARGLPRIALDTAEGADHLVRLYGGRGYREVGHCRWPGKTYRSVVMVKEIRP